MSRFLVDDSAFKSTVILSKNCQKLTKLILELKVNIISCYENYLTELELHEGIRMVDCRWNLITELNLPKTATYIECDLLNVINFNLNNNLKIIMYL